MRTLAIPAQGIKRSTLPTTGEAVEIQTHAGQVINATPNFGGVKIVVECFEHVCEAFEFSMSSDEWGALVRQGNAAILRGGQ